MSQGAGFKCVDYADYLTRTTPGQYSFQEILTYVEKQFDNVLNEESRIKRNTKSVDSRVHGILYFITPNGHGLREVDIVFMRKLGTRANILPVIAKSDSLTPKELREFKKKVCVFLFVFFCVSQRINRFERTWPSTSFHTLISPCTRKRTMRISLKRTRLSGT